MSSQILDEARSIASAWGDTGWLDGCQIVYSRRLRRSLGVTYPARHLIRLHPLLETDRALRATVLCHELAHLKVYWQQGAGALPHGPAWRTLARHAGGDPSAKLFVPALSASSTTRPGKTYRHRCPRCIAQGLTGELVIEALR